MANTFRELAVRSESGDLINELTENNNILATIPMAVANKGIQNVAKKMSSVTGAQVVDMDQALPTVDANGELITTDVTYIAGQQEVGKNQAELMGGASVYFNEYSDVIMEETGNNIEKSFIYNTVKPFALENTNRQNAGGSNSGSMYSMVCVRYDKHNTGLYSEVSPGAGLNFEIMPLSSGGVYLNSSNIAVYGQLMTTNIGFQFVDSRNASYISNIDLVADSETVTGFTAMPTEIQMDEMLLQSRAEGGNSFIYMHPRVKNALHAYKGEKLQLQVFDENYKRSFDMWEGVRIITSFNMLQTEATESFA